MTAPASAYGEALYALAQDEELQEIILQQLTILDQCFAREPKFLQLLGDPGLPVAERCRVVDTCFWEQVHGYLLNFLKLLIEKGQIRHFDRCVSVYRALYDDHHGLLRVTAVTNLPMTDTQRQRLTGKLCQITGRPVDLDVKLDPGVLGGVRLDYAGKRIDGTLRARLEAIKNILSNTGP